MATLIPQANTYEKPASIDEAVTLLKTDTGKTLVYAGGTALAFSQPKVERIIDISELPLKGCELNSDDDLKIGALTTINQLEKDSNARRFCGGIIPMATDKLASTPLRNLITVGGNLAAGYAWSDLPVALLAMDAQYSLLPSKSLTPIPCDGEISFRRLAEDGALISHVVLDGAFRNRCGSFLKFARTSTDLAMVTVAVTMDIKNNTMNSVRIAAGGLVAIPQRLKNLEVELEGQTPGEELFQNTARNVNIRVRPDTRASEDYRLEVLKTLITRACLNCAKGAC